ncbi:anaerobic ribonucleoside-triphosphate reductase activating protein [Drancourtella sp. An177]|nr:anaerobic ribonucleoside-triphosphate reductase activating protein [Drancourtella sp. An177]
MRIQGLQKLTLLDYPGKAACTIFTAGCNFRCPYCHNAYLVTQTESHDDIDQEEIFAFLKRRKGILDGVCVSGGEPLLQNGLEEFLRQIREMGYAVKLDTNGSFPERLDRFIEQGLIDYVAMDLKNSRKHYGQTIGVPGFDIRPIEDSVDILMEGRIPYEFRTTVVREFHQRSDFEEMGLWIRGAKRYFLQQFEDSGNLIRPGLHSYDRSILEQALEIVRKYVPQTELRGI